MSISLSPQREREREREREIDGGMDGWRMERTEQRMEGLETTKEERVWQKSKRCV